MKHQTRILRQAALLLSLFLLFSLFPLSGAAAGTRYLYFEGHGTLLLHEKDGEEYISLYGSALYAGGSGVFDSASRTMRVKISGREIVGSDGQTFVTSNGKMIDGARNFISSGVFYVPLSSLAEALDKTLEARGSRYYLVDKPAKPVNDDLDPDCVLWLARIIFCESCGQPFEGQVAVGSVVLNRVDSPEFPNTIFSVIFDRKYGVQFAPAGNGAVWCTPDDTAIEAAKTALRGDRTDDRILYFMNADLATTSWISDNRVFAFKIGDHSFYY